MEELSKSEVAAADQALVRLALHGGRLDKRLLGLVAVLVAQGDEEVCRLLVSSSREFVPLRECRNRWGWRVKFRLAPHGTVEAAVLDKGGAKILRVNGLQVGQ